MPIDYLSAKSNLSRCRIIGTLVKLLANYFPLIIFLGVIIGFSAAFLINRLDYATRGIIIGIPALLASYSLIKIRKYGRLDSNLNLFHFNNYSMTGLFIALYLFSVSSIIISSTRPWYYFVLIAFLFCIVGVQIFTNNRNQNLILIEIIAIIINLAYGVVLKYPYYFGFTDTSYLIGLSKVTLLSGQVVPPDFDISYASFPLYHIYLAEIAAMLGLDVQTVLFVVMIIPYAVVTFFIFKLFYKISNNVQISLLIPLIYASLSVVILYGTYIQTRVMAYIGFIILFYIFFKEASAGESKLPYRVIFFIMLAYLILVHQVSIFQIIFLLLWLFIIEWLISEKRVIRLDLLTTIFIATFSYWLFEASEYLRMVFPRFNIMSSDDLLMIKPSVQIGNEWYFVFNNIDTAILVFFILCGIGYLLYVERRNYLVVFALFGMLMLPFFVPNPLQLLWSSMILFRADRMMLLLAPFFAFLMAYGIYVLLNYFETQRISKKICGGILVSIIFFFALFSMILINASDSKDIPWMNQKKYFDQAEIRGFNYMTNYIPLGSTLTSDYYVNRYFGVYIWFSKSYELNFPYYKTAYLNSSSSTITGKGYLIIRDREFQYYGLLIASQIPNYHERLIFNQETQTQMNILFESANLLYDNRNIIIALSPTRSY